MATLALALEETGHDDEPRLLPLLTHVDRRIRHHLTRARTAAQGGRDRARSLLAPKIADHLAAFSMIYAEKCLDFRMDVAAETAVACEAHDLDEMLGNLIENACTWGGGQSPLPHANGDAKST